MRAILCAAALVSLCSAARAERINIVGVVANYVTERDAVDIEIWLDRPLDMERERLTFGGSRNGDANGVRFSFANATDSFNIQVTERANGSVVSRVTTPDVPYVSDRAIRQGELRDIIATTIDADLIRLNDIVSGDMRFVYGANVVSSGELVANVWGYSTVNAPHDTAVPEPAAVVLCLLGVVGLGVHRLVRRPRLRL